MEAWLLLICHLIIERSLGFSPAAARRVGHNRSQSPSPPLPRGGERGGPNSIPVPHHHGASQAAILVAGLRPGGGVAPPPVQPSRPPGPPCPRPRPERHRRGPRRAARLHRPRIRVRRRLPPRRRPQALGHSPGPRSVLRRPPRLPSRIPASELSSSDGSTASPDLGSPVSFFSPGDSPEERKARLKQWAQVVACSLRQRC
ncbi:unnamed protein product [Musa textilis]